MSIVSSTYSDNGVTTNASLAPGWSFIDFVERLKQQYQPRERLAQTTVERLRIAAESTKFPVFGRGIARARTAAQVKLELMGVAHTRVTCTLADYNATDMTDVFQQATTPIDEIDGLAGAISMASGRRRDQIKIDALIAAVTASVVTKSVAATGVGTEAPNHLNIERINAAHYQLDIDEVPSEGRHIAVHAKDLEQFVNTTKAGSADYNQLMLLQNGGLKDRAVGFGFTWHKLGTRTEGGLAVAANVRQGFAWHESAIGYATGALKKEHDMDWLADYGADIVSEFIKAGACVIDPLGVVQVLMTEA